MEYEINPEAGGQLSPLYKMEVHWPDVTKFSLQHATRFTLGKPEQLHAIAIFGLLTDYPHEICHLIQVACGHVIRVEGDPAGWLAEHDPSVMCLNLLHAVLAEPSTGEDEFDLPGLVNTCVLWYAERIILFHARMQPTEIEGYRRWRRSMGFDDPCIDAASVATDYLKVRAGLDAYPLAIEQQMIALFGGDRTGDVRSLPRPPVAASFPPGTDIDADDFIMRVNRRHDQV